MQGVTVVIPVWHGKPFLEKALKSVKRQTTDWPLQTVVVEDGTPDVHERCQDIAEQYGAEYHFLEPNRGVAQARKFGAEHSRFSSGYLAFLDQDDIWYPDFLKISSQALDQAPDAAFSLVNANFVYPDGRQYRLYQTKRPSLTLSDLKMYNHIVSPSQVLMRLEAFRTIDWPRPLKSPGADDWLLWLSLLGRGYRALYIDTVLMAYLEHDQGAHQDIPKMRQSEASVVNDWYSTLGFSSWDQRRYWARVGLDEEARAIKTVGWRKAVPGLIKKLAGDPLAYLSAFWYKVERRQKHLV